jgi:hypothetical protein
MRRLIYQSNVFRIFSYLYILIALIYLLHICGFADRLNVFKALQYVIEITQAYQTQFKLFMYTRDLIKMVIYEKITTTFFVKLLLYRT